MKTFIVLIASALISVSAFATTDKSSKKSNKETEVVAVSSENSAASVQLIGSIIDNENNETLAGATLYVNGSKYYSDLDGNFVLPNLTPGKHQIRVELISYKTSEMEIDVQANKKMDIHLVQK